MRIMSALTSLSLAAVLTVAVTAWSGLVAQQLGDVPYMDEIFHIPQAQEYCDGRFSHWDPKITTPPGLYLASYAASFLTGDCHSALALRGVNIIAIGAVFWCAYYLLGSPLASFFSQEIKPRAFSRALVAFSIGLFPPLFFFSGLYYTDVLSTAVVLAQLCCCMEYIIYIQDRNAPKRPAGIAGVAIRQGMIIITGILAVMCRQTNIFWVAIFPALLTGTAVLKGSMEATELDEQASWNSVISCAWKHSKVYDPHVSAANIQTIPKLVVSLAIVAINRPVRLITYLLPYAILVVLFIAFVFINGGVVLGDKSNHIATIHVTQILYLGAYIVAFSLPLFIPLVLLAVSNARAIFPSSLITYILMVIGGLVGTGGIVYFNTIVHPFLLADNRHFVFYIFRIFRVWPWTRYAAIPVYFGSISLIGMSFGWWPKNQIISTTGRDHKDISPTLSSISKHNSNRGAENAIGSANRYSHAASVPMILIATTALSIITAPLVEPRYFIIPWILWRITVSQTLYPSSLVSIVQSSSAQSVHRIGIVPFSTGQVTLALALEIVWLAVVNVVVGNLFLYHPFQWKHALEEGLQRFMW